MLFVAIGFLTGVLFGKYLRTFNFSEKRQKWNDLTSLVKTRNYGRVKTFFITLQMVVKLYWFQFIHNSLEYKDRHNIILSYVINGKLYKIVVGQKKGPVPVSSVIDEDGTDMTGTILPFYGPNQDWHKRVFTPCFWNRRKLVFTMNTGETKTFFTDDPIII